MGTISYADIRDHIPDVVGEQCRINHIDCPAGTDTRQRLYIKRTHEAVLAYCHNCTGKLIRSANGVRRIDVIQRLLAAAEAEPTHTDVQLPDDMRCHPADFPIEARAWLYRYHLNDEDIKNHHIGYSPSLGRVILPVYEDGKCIFWQGRQIDGAGPKYISVRSAKKPVFMAEAEVPMYNATITEDMLSAIRMSKYRPEDGPSTKTHCTGVALLGTNGPDDLAVRLAGFKWITVWLDDDVAGRTKATEIAQRMKLVTNASVRIIHAPEPKKLSDKEIKESYRK